MLFNTNHRIENLLVSDFEQKQVSSNPPVSW